MSELYKGCIVYYPESHEFEAAVHCTYDASAFPHLIQRGARSGSFVLGRTDSFASVLSDSGSTDGDGAGGGGGAGASGYASSGGFRRSSSEGGGANPQLPHRRRTSLPDGCRRMSTLASATRT